MSVFYKNKEKNFLFYNINLEISEAIAVSSMVSVKEVWLCQEKEKIFINVKMADGKVVI